jgi:hypothetical protein
MTSRVQIICCWLAVFLSLSVFVPVQVQAGIDNWYVRSNPSLYQLNKAAFGNGEYVVVGNGGTILTSTDGESWASAVSGTTSDLYDVLYTGNMFVAVGGMYSGAGVILTSADGHSWNVSSLPAAGTISNVAYGNGILVALAAKGVWTSTNGTGWTYHQVLNAGLEELNSITFGEGKFMACSNYSFWPYDGPNNGGLYWVYTSLDGTYWNINSNGAVSYNMGCNRISYENGIYFGTTWFFLGNNFYNDVVTSPDGNRWIYTNLGNGLLSEVAYGNGIYAVSSSWGGLVYVSQDIINWEPISTGITGTFSSMSYLNETFIIVGSSADGTGLIVQSDSDAVEIPVASAGMDQTIHAGGMATLDGSGSSDPNGYYPLTYSWSIFSTPAGSTAELSDPAAVNPSFTLDRAGTYTIQLIVTNSYGKMSLPVYTIVSTVNTAPIAEAGDDQAITQRWVPIHLSGTQSYDLDGDPITYTWSILQRPTQSTAELSNADTASPALIPDVYGTYIVQLTVSDPWGAVGTDIVTLSFNNLKPVANAGQNQSIIVGDTSVLDGSDSTDANGDSLSYMWSLSSYPEGSTASIADPTAMQTALIPDLPGTYVLSLIVSDGLLSSDPSNISIVVTPSLTAFIGEVQGTVNMINGFSPVVFKNKNLANTLTNKLNAVILQAQQGQYASALDSLQNDIMKKTDGCATKGSPDNNDWITRCSEQSALYNQLIQIRDLLQGLM